MATIETSQDATGRDAEAGRVYDGFISYSHAADDLLAPRLQAGLQRFAKPWWRRRALRIFRDESSLSANPHLWSSITDALDESGWFVLLLSPEAAESPWVNNEVEYWLEHKDAERIIPVLTDGEFGWADGDVTGDALPPSLQGAFASEPRWVDLRFGHTDEQLDLQNPQFSAAIADVASAIRGVPKDELASEEVRQHRRTRRTAWAAGVGLVVLALATGVFAVQSLRSASLARSRQLAAASVSVVDHDPDLGLMLGVASASNGDVTLESEQAIRSALRQHRSLFYVALPQGYEPVWTSSAALSPDGALLAAAWGANRLEVWEIDAGRDEPLWAVDLPLGLRIEFMRFTTDGAWLVANAFWWDIEVNDPTVAELPPPDIRSGTYIWDAYSGDEVRFISLECPFFLTQRGIHYFDTNLPVVNSPDNLFENNLPANRACDTGSAPTESEIITVFDLQTGATLGEVEVPAHASSAELAPDPTRIVVHFSGEPSQQFDYRTGELMGAAPEGWLDSSLDAKLYLSGASGVPQSIRDTASGATIFEVNAAVPLPPIGFLTPDAKGVVSVGPGESGLVTKGSQTILLSGHDGMTMPFLVMNTDGTRVATSSADKTVRVWSLEPIRGEIGGYALSPGFRAYAGLDVYEDRAAVLSYPTSGPWLFDLFLNNLTQWAEGHVVVNDRNTGDILATIDGIGGKVVRFSPDGTRLAAQSSSDELYGPVWVYDATSGERLVEMEGLCLWAPHPSLLTCAEGQGVPAGAIDLDYSPDGSMLAMAGGASQQLMVWDPATGASLFTSEPLGYSYPLTAVQFSPTGDVVVVSSKQGSWVFATDTWQQVGLISHQGAPALALRFTPDGSRLVQAQAHTGDVAVWETDTWQDVAVFEAGAGQIRDLEISSDSRVVVTAHNDGVIAVHDIERGELLHLLPIGEDVANVEFVDDDKHLLVTTAFGSAEVFTLDIDELLATARSRLTRTFTEAECAELNLEPCPTLKELRRG